MPLGKWAPKNEDFKAEDSFGMGNVSPAVTFMLRPMYWDISRAQAIETNDKIRKSNYKFLL